MQCKHTIAPCPATTRGQSSLISFDAKGALFAYPAEKSVVVRTTDGAGQPRVFTGHAAKVTVARLSPSGFRCASCDETGKLLVWSTKEGNMVSQATLQPLSAPAKDLSWTEDEERLAVVGEGRTSMAAVLMIPAGNTLGEVSGHTKTIHTCALRPIRPFRLLTGAADSNVNFYEGPPFKFHHSVGAAQTGARNAVTCVRYAPGAAEVAAAVSGSSDIALLDGKSGEIKEKVASKHSGTVYQIAWAPDGAAVITASADKTVRATAIPSGDAKWCATLGTHVNQMQVGLAISEARGAAAALSLEGDLTWLNLADGAVTGRWRGHGRPVRRVAMLDGGKMVSVSSDAKAVLWAGKTSMETDTFETKGVPGAPFDFCKAAAFDGQTLAAATADAIIGFDCATKTASQLASMTGVVDVAAVGKGVFVVAKGQELSVISGGKVVATEKIPTGNGSVKAMAAAADVIAVGMDKGAVLLYTINGTAITARRPPITGTHTAAISAIAVDATGTLVCAGDIGKQLFVYNAKDGEVRAHDGMGFHAAQVTAIAFADSPAGKGATAPLLATASTDDQVFVWDLAAEAAKAPSKKSVNGMNVCGGVTAVAFDGAELVIGTNNGTIFRAA